MRLTYKKRKVFLDYNCLYYPLGRSLNVKCLKKAMLFFVKV